MSSRQESIFPDVPIYDNPVRTLYVHTEYFAPAASQDASLTTMRMLSDRGSSDIGSAAPAWHVII